jgi:hypothetical protein
MRVGIPNTVLKMLSKCAYHKNCVRNNVKNVARLLKLSNAITTSLRVLSKNVAILLKTEQCHQHIPEGVVHTGGEQPVLAGMEVEAHNPMNMACKTKKLIP